MSAAYSVFADGRGTLMGTLGTLSGFSAFQNPEAFSIGYPVEERWERWNAAPSL
jgi:hypothetical protein